MTETRRLWEITEAFLNAEQLELDDLEVLGNGRAHTLRVTVDGEGVDLDRLSEVSRGLSRLYDTEYETDGSYQLEVSSPGLERALRRPRHFEKAVGREVVLKGRAEDGRVQTHRGVLVAADGDGVTVGADGDDHRYDYQSVISARTVFRWESTPKPGKKE